MGKLNNIQNKIAKAQESKLADISFPFTGKGQHGNSNTEWDPDNPDASLETEYASTGTGGMFGLSFTQRDTEIFKLEQNDQKAIIMACNCPTKPENGDVITYTGGSFLVIDQVIIPAGNGWILQLRAYE